ncbi:hypothetical protein [Lactiplantibacillus plantarum]|nr:hypothetical protein [Lactiplantibacillus plantarum]MDO8173932.1 hypothetical protein [Lactiplantibacillus plantarum]
MKLKIDGENANLKVTTDNDLSFKQLVMAYSLVTVPVIKAIAERMELP